MILTILTGLLKLLNLFASYAADKQLMDAGEAKVVNDVLAESLARIERLALCALTLVVTQSCGGSLHNVSIGESHRAADALRAQITAEVCSAFEYITYDDQLDTKQTLKEIAEKHNYVLAEVYHCALPK